MEKLEKPERLAKLLARAGVASRRDVEKMVGQGRIMYRGVVVAHPALLLSTLDGVVVDGKPVHMIEPARLWCFHKPAGCVTTTRDPQGRPTVFDHIPRSLPRVVTVGRLDFTTEGLLLLTTDGALARHLELPSSGYARCYRVRAHGRITQGALDGLAQGVCIDGVHYGPILAKFVKQQASNVWLEVTIREGKNREVRRICEYLGLEVTRLIRTAYGPFVLGDLGYGATLEVAPDLLATMLPDFAGASVRVGH
jgi:23S rRNA pseudouridine2605 synthase